MEKSIVYLTMSVGGIYLILDEFYGKKRISQFVSQVVPSVSITGNKSVDGVVNGVMNGKALDTQIVDKVKKDPVGGAVNIIKKTTPLKFVGQDDPLQIGFTTKDMTPKQKTIAMHGQDYYDTYGIAPEFKDKKEGKK
jgi:hypothetical protein